LEGLGVDVNITLRIVTKWDGWVWNGFFWPGTGTSGRLLWMWLWTCWNIQGIFWLA